MKKIIKKIAPPLLLGWYHLFLAWLGAFLYGFPSNKMIIIGVTGTNGKTTVSYFIAKMLELLGKKSGLTSTAMFKIDQHEWLNDKKMTMLGRFQSQRMLRDMSRAGCKYVVLETSSEGIKQHRHRGIDYDVAVFTNLTPEHLEAHGGFENYKKAKGELFAALTSKHRNKQTNKQKIAVVNADDEYADYFLSFPADQKVIFSMDPTNLKGGAGTGEIVAENIENTKAGSRFEVFGTEFTVNMPGEFNVYNALAAVAVVNALGVPLEDCAKALEKIKGVPGRLEIIDEGQDFTVMVDYAPEVVSVQNLYDVVSELEHERVIHVLGSCGGGRDRDRQPKLGRIAGENADLVFVTNEDPYDDDPMEIIDAVARGALDAGKQDGLNLFRQLDRAQTIRDAVAAARTGDIILITGKGCEQAMCVAGGQKVPWDDRRIAREALRERNTKPKAQNPNRSTSSR